MPDAAPLRQLQALLELPGVEEAAESAREACTRLRFHEVLRRRTPQAAAESRFRGASASAALDGARLPADRVREAVRGVVAWSDQADPVEQVLRAAWQVTAETERVAGIVLTSPAQALARLHVAAMAGVLPADQVGRPRTGSEAAAELADLGPAPSAPGAARRLAAVGDLLGAGSLPGVPGLLVAALAHAEVAVLRPFVRGNGLIARALERAVVQACGLDPTGVAVTEAGHLAAGTTAYVGSLAAYRTGSADGVALWLRHCGTAVVAAAAEGQRLCDAVYAGRPS